MNIAIRFELSKEICGFVYLKRKSKEILSQEFFQLSEGVK